MPQISFAADGMSWSEAVNNVEVARDGWRRLGDAQDDPTRFVEVICSNPGEHRRCVESRTAEMPGHGVPTWDQVQRRRWEPFTGTRLLIDTVVGSEASTSAVLSWLKDPIARVREER